MQSFIAQLQKWWQARRAQRISLSYARTRVHRGAAYLDEVDAAWYCRVDPHTLELSSGSSCILGQLHGDFRMGLSRSHLINLSSAPRASLSPVSYGFQCVGGVSDAAQEQDYEYLNQAWKEAVQRRQTRDAAVVDEPGGEGLDICKRLDALFAAHAPVWAVVTESDADRPGAIMLDAAGRPAAPAADERQRRRSSSSDAGLG